MILLDNDAIHKLAAYDAIEEFFLALNITPQDVFVLATAKFRFMTRNEAKGIQRYGKETFERIKALLASAKEITEVGSTADVFDDIPSIDVGEKMLFGAALAFPEAIVVTGDKRAIRAVVETDGLNDVADKLSGRIICLEQLVRKMIACSGFEPIRQKMSIAQHADNAIRAAFGCDNDCTAENVEYVLLGYESELRGLRIDVLWIAESG